MHLSKAGWAAGRSRWRRTKVKGGVSSNPTNLSICRIRHSFIVDRHLELWSLGTQDAVDDAAQHAVW